MNNQGFSPQGMQDLLGNQAKLFKKILNVVSKVEKIEKSGYNSHQKYHYSTESDLINAVRGLLAENKLLILTDSETKEVIKVSKTDKDGKSKESLVTVVNTRHTFCDTETGYTYPIQSTGAGWDDLDKGVYKGLTGAMKYFVSKNFLVPTEDDPENDGETKPVQKSFNRGGGSINTKLPPNTIVTNDNIGTTQSAATPNIVTNVASGPISTSAPSIVANTAEIPKHPNITVINTPNLAPNNVAKPSFGRRAATKSEPNFP